METMNAVNFQSQLSSIMEMLAKTAVVEIGKLVDECSATLRLEISRHSRENDLLRKKCQFLESELKSLRGTGKTFERKTLNFNDGAQFYRESRGGEDRNPPTIDSVFGKDWCMNLWREDGPNPRVQGKEDLQSNSCTTREESIDLVDEEPDMILIKEETLDACLGNSNVEREPMNNRGAPVMSCNDISERVPRMAQSHEENFIAYSMPSDNPMEQNTEHRVADSLVCDPIPTALEETVSESVLDSEQFAGLYQGSMGFNNIQNPRTGMGDKKFECVFCGKSFSYLSYLKVHVRRHSGEKPFGCTVCGKRFAQKTYLKLHQRTHSGEKPYTCMECGKSFSQKSSLNVHLRSHTGEKPYNCVECGKSYAYKHGFNTHQCNS